MLKYVIGGGGEGVNGEGDGVDEGDLYAFTCFMDVNLVWVLFELRTTSLQEVLPCNECIPLWLIAYGMGIRTRHGVVCVKWCPKKW